MIEFVTDDNLFEYEAFLKSHPRGSYLQGFDWSRVNPDRRWRGLVCRNKHGRVTGVVSYLVHELPILPYQMMYCCRGPICSGEDEDTFYELLGALKEAAKQERACLVRVDAPFADSNQTFSHVLALRHYHIRKHRRSLPDYPKRSWIVPLRDQTWGSLQEKFSAEHYQNIQIAIRHGVDIRRGGRALIPAFTDLMEKKALREEALGKEAAYYASIAETYGDNAKIYLAYVDNRPVAGAMMLKYGRTCYCVAEADLSNPSLHAKLLLRAYILQVAVESGFTFCEFPGLPGSKDSPAYLFEEGFGGRPQVYLGEADWLRLPLAGLLARLILKIQHTLEKRKYLIHIR